MERIVRPRCSGSVTGVQYGAGLSKHLSGAFAFTGGGPVLSTAGAFGAGNAPADCPDRRIKPFPMLPGLFGQRQEG